jgi:uncharacterized alpha-E superfamily protein
MTPLTLHPSISANKADRLFWLGRYTERAYRTLHILRKYFDQMIDENPYAYTTFTSIQGIENRYLSPDDFIQRYLYDGTNPDSLMSMLEQANDNAIVLREEIRSETLSYIQLSICYMKKCEPKSRCLDELQPITDNILAFWGSLDERVSDSHIRNMIGFGRFIESMDLHIRFGYPYLKICQIFDRLSEIIDKENFLCESVTFEKLKSVLTFDRYRDHETLALLNRLYQI